MDLTTFDEDEPDRLAAFLKRLFCALVGDDCSSASVQGQLVYANASLMRSYIDGMADYLTREAPDQTLADTELGALAIFLVETMIANHGQALDDKDVSYFKGVRAELEVAWLRGIRYFELDDKADDVGLSSAEAEERARIEDLAFDWDEFFDRTERCIANWCLKNTTLVDRHGSPVLVGGFATVPDIFADPQPCACCGKHHLGKLCEA